jgi:hypothetical protein
MRRLAAFALAIALLFAPAAFAQAPAPSFNQAIADTVAWLNRMGEGKLVLGAQPVISAKGDSEQATLRGVILRSPEGELTLGDIVVDKAEIAGGLWRLTGALPAAMAFTGKDVPATTVMIARSSFEVVIDPRTGWISASKLDAADLALIVAGLGRVTAADFAFDSRTETQPAGRASLPSTYRLGGISVRDDTGRELATLRAIRGRQNWDGVALDRAQDLQTFLFSSGGSEAEMEKQFERMIKPDVIARGLAYRFEAEGLAVGDGAGGKLGALDGASFEATLTGLDTNHATLSFGFRHSGLEIQLPFLFDPAVVPELVELDFAIEPLPVTALLAVIDDPEADAKSESLLKRAGTALKLRIARLKAGIVSAELEGELRGDDNAAGGVVGRGALSVTNLDKVIESAGPLIEEYKAVIQLVAAMGQKTTGADGQPVTRWEIESGADGRTLLNGNDVSALVAQAAAGDNAPLTPDRVKDALEERGYDVGLSKTRAGAPRLTAELDDDGLEGETLEIVLRDCKDGTCEGLTFGATLSAKRTVPLARVNDWNLKNKQTRAARVKEREVRLEMDLGGDDVKGDGLGENIDTYIEILTKFAGQVRGRQ